MAEPQVEVAPAADGAEAAPVEEKKKRGKPKDEHAPPKPRNPYGRHAAECRPRLKETKPELVSDLSAMGKAIAEEWAAVPEAKKAELQAAYEEEMTVWKPLWAAYKETRNYKDFVEVKTDYLDKRAQKKLVKTMNKDAPKRPKSGYMIFAGTVREEVMVIVREQNLGLAGAGSMIAERWNALTEGQKGEFGEQSQRQKISFDKEFAVYKLTDAFGNFCDGRAKLESTQQLKKLVRTHLDEAPKKSPSGYALFRSEVMPPILKTNAEAAADAKLSMGDMGKKVSGMWKDLTDEKKAAFNNSAVPLKEGYDKAFKEFKTNLKYTAYLEKRQKVKIRENLLVNLREMPKRPKSVFAMFSKEHKDEVPPGKGEGKGTHALRQKFELCPVEEKKKYEEEVSKLTDEWKEQVVEFKAGPKYKTFETTKQKIFMEFKNEAIKVTTLKFLDEAPPGPAKTAFAIFVGEKRKASGEPEGQKKSKEQKREEVVKAKDEWMKLDKGMRDGYESTRKDLLRAYEEEVRQYIAGERWQEYQKEAKRLRIPIKSLLYHKKKIMKKTADGKLHPASVQLPEKPDLFPSRPQNVMQIFIAEKKKTVDTVAEINEMWKNLTPEDKAPFDQQAAEQVKKYGDDMREFKASDEGKKYFRDTSAAQRRRGMITARNKYLDDYPKKPTGALFEWMKVQAKKLRKEAPELKGFELKKKLTDMWSGEGETPLSAEDKEPFVKAAAERAQEYTDKMKEFKDSDNWKRYCSATKVRKFGGKAKGIPAPANLPKKPVNAFQTFVQEIQSKGSRANVGEMHKQFKELSEEEKKRYMSTASEKAAQYKEDLDEFEKSDVGRKFRMQSSAFVKRNRLNGLKARFLKDEPSKPKGGAFTIFMNDNRSKVQSDNPDLKGDKAVQIKLTAMYREMSADDRKQWEDKFKEELEAYKEKVAEFQSTADYKKYLSLLGSVTGAGKGKAAKGKVVREVIPMPPKPDNLPKSPLNAMFIFGEETRANGGPRGIPEVSKLWKELDAEGLKKYQDKAVEQRKQYDIDMKEFQESVEGKKYLRLKAEAGKRKRLSEAKSRYLGTADGPKEPKRPPGAYFIFLGDKSADMTGDKSTKASELAKSWSAMSPEDKKEYEDKAKELKEQYDSEMQAYKSSQGFKAFQRATNSITGVKAKTAMVKVAKAKMAAGRGGKGRGRGAAVARPAAKKAAGSASNSDQMGSDSSSKSKKSSKSSKKSSSSSKSSKSSNSD